VCTFFTYLSLDFVLFPRTFHPAVLVRHVVELPSLTIPLASDRTVYYSDAPSKAVPGFVDRNPVFLGFHLFVSLTEKIVG
jgi:hypothetical protein